MDMLTKQQLENSQPTNPIYTLPSYLYGYCCDERHFLTLSKDVRGKWNISYTAWAPTEHSLHNLYANDQPTIEEAAQTLIKMREQNRAQAT